MWRVLISIPRHYWLHTCKDHSWNIYWATQISVIVRSKIPNRSYAGLGQLHSFYGGLHCMLNHSCSRMCSKSEPLTTLSDLLLCSIICFVNRLMPGPPLLTPPSCNTLTVCSRWPSVDVAILRSFYGKKVVDILCRLGTLFIKVRFSDIGSRYFWFCSLTIW